MPGVIFIVNVPQKQHQEDMKEKYMKTDALEKEKYENTFQIVNELKEKKFGTKKDDRYMENNTITILKSKSIDYLNKEDATSNLFKSHSEKTLNSEDLSSDSSGSLKTSWREIKQIIKPKKNKFRISTPVRGVDILNAFHWDTPLEKILSEVVLRLGVENASWSRTNDNKYWQVIFSVESGNSCEELLQVLRTLGIGSRYQSSISVVPSALYYKSTNSLEYQRQQLGFENESNTAWSRFSSSVRARNNLAQVLHDVRRGAALTFDWLFLLVVAAFVAAFGLVENSTVILVASMLISPLMGPITAATLGTAVRDPSLQLMGIMHELLGLFLSLVIGFIFGLTICALDEWYGMVDDWPTYEMITRCELHSLWVGIAIAIPSGAGVALAVLGEYTASLVGVAISASLLPPAVNAGLLWAMSLVRLIVPVQESRWAVTRPLELVKLGTASLCLTLVNIACIFVAGVAVYKVKKVCSLSERDISWWVGNKNRLNDCDQDIKENSKIFDEVYSKWCNEADKINRKEEGVLPSVIHSDTVTYRRNQGIDRQKAQNIETVYSEMHNETYTPLDDNKENIINNKLNNTPKIDNHSDHGTDKKGSFYSPEKEFQKEETEKNNYPILEPSLSYTVDSRNPVIMLESRSFHV
ncbi:uncharacterized protein LOC114247675 [Bombyx mandarina]|uniref:Uncharacterized protein LOC114247675 n=1 Tax=Bombyx mandarina TaxID=7092 RepID=A0A6J2K2M5_BOMMA|nr:uncharacterized protein LOC114247675 [Bombyx mandarina]